LAAEIGLLQAAENLVNRPNQRAAAAEISLQAHVPALSSAAAELRCQIAEQRRVREAKGVDALLDITDNEARAESAFLMGDFWRDKRQDRILQFVCVLVLVDQHFIELPP